MGVGAGFWILLGASVAVFLAAAKTHGRQIRLERELRGHWEVDFRKANPPFVEALWKRDRLRFWVNILRFAPFFIFGFSIWGANGLPLPGIDGTPSLVDLLAVLFLSVVLWTPIVAFLLNAQKSRSRLRDALGEPHQDALGLTRAEVMRRERPTWIRDAMSGTILWWSLSMVGVVGIIGMVAAGV